MKVLLEIPNKNADALLDVLQHISYVKTKPFTDVFWHQKTVDELAEEQGVSPIYDLDGLFGCGKDLWETEEEWNDFQRSIQAGRKERA
jgi:hypothetical protein